MPRLACRRSINAKARPMSSPPTTTAANQLAITSKTSAIQCTPGHRSSAPGQHVASVTNPPSLDRGIRGRGLGGRSFHGTQPERCMLRIFVAVLVAITVGYFFLHGSGEGQAASTRSCLEKQGARVEQSTFFEDVFGAAAAEQGGEMPAPFMNLVRELEQYLYDVHFA